MKINAMMMVAMLFVLTSACGVVENPDNWVFAGGDGGSSDGGDLCMSTDCGHGDCELKDGNPVCKCDTGWSGTSCSVDNCPANKCVAPQTCRPLDGTCIDPADPCVPSPCNSHGTCANNAGTAVCSCELGWSGDTCATENCPTGKCQSPQTCRPSDGTCIDPANPCVPDPCNAHGTCSNNAGTAVCSCSNNWTGANCNNCPVGSYVNTGGQCVDDPCLPNVCQNGGTCSRPAGTAVCSCSNNWSGADCNTCPAGSYVNGSGNCVDDPCLPDPCSAHGTCSKPSGTAVCSCSNNWSGADCNTCPAGSYVNGSGNCVDDPCLPDPCNAHGTCSKPSGSAVCACAGNWDPATSCAACLPGFGGANCDPVAVLAVTQNAGAATTLTNTVVVALRFRVTASGGTGYLSRMTFSTALTGSAMIQGQTLYRNGSTTVYTLTRSAGRIVAVVASAEDQVVPGTPNDYILEVTIGGASSGNTLTVALLGDAAATPTMVGGTGYVYNVAGSRLYSNPGDLCSVNGPNMVWAGLAHTAPTPTCNIAAFGDPVYSTGFEIGAWSVSNTMTAP